MLAKPFETPGEVIYRLLNFYEGKNSKPQKVKELFQKPINTVQVDVVNIDPNNQIDLHHTKISTCSIEGKIGPINWNKIVMYLHEISFHHFASFENMQNFTPSNIAKGFKSNDGFHFSKAIDISIQNVDANVAFRNIKKFADKFHYNISIDLVWRNNPKALHPGKAGRISL